jgi:hypothetical protein
MKAAVSSDFAGTGWSGSGILELCAGVFSNRPQLRTLLVFEALWSFVTCASFSHETHPKAADMPCLTKQRIAEKSARPDVDASVINCVL